jgi:hypothetical protein
VREIARGKQPEEAAIPIYPLEFYRRAEENWRRSSESLRAESPPNKKGDALVRWPWLLAIGQGLIRVCCLRASSPPETSRGAYLSDLKKDRLLRPDVLKWVNTTIIPKIDNKISPGATPFALRMPPLSSMSVGKLYDGETVIVAAHARVASSRTDTSMRRGRYDRAMVWVPRGCGKLDWEGCRRRLGGNREIEGSAPLGLARGMEAEWPRRLLFH